MEILPFRSPISAAIALSLLSSPPARSASLIWEKVRGPEGGDIRMLSSWADTVVAIDVRGDSYRSTDAGITWNLWRRSLGQPGRYLPLAADPIRIGDRLVGPSAEGGLLLFQGDRSTLVRSPLWGQEAVPVGLTRIGDTLLVAANGVYLSADSGTTWTRRENILGDFAPVAMAQAGGTLLAAASHTSGHSLHESRDLGASWKELTIPLPPNLYVAGMLGTGEGVLAWSNNGTCLRLRRNGSTWIATAGKLPTDEQSVALLSRAGGIWCLSASGLHLSRDGGATWIPQATAPPSFGQALTVLPGGDLLAGTPVGVFAWDSRTGSWRPRQSGLGETPIQDLVKRGSELVAKAERALYRSRDGGATWKPITSPSGTNVSGKLVLLGPDILVMGGDHVYPLLPGDSLGSDIRQEFPFQPVDIIRSGDRWLIWGIFTSSKRPMISRDGRKTWEYLGSPRWFPDRLNFAAHGARMAAIDADSILYSHDSGITWQSAATPNTTLHLPRLFPTDRSWYMSGEWRYRSADPAQGWSPIPSMPWIKGLLGTDADLHAVTDSGYYRSVDGGVTWERPPTGLAGSEYANLRANATTWFTPALDGGYWVASLAEAPPVRLPPFTSRPSGDARASAPVRVLSAEASGGQLRLHLQLARPTRIGMQALSAKGAVLSPHVELHLGAGNHQHHLPMPTGAMIWRLETHSGGNPAIQLLHPRRMGR